MRTITPEEVEAAFHETGYQPVSYTYLYTETKCACALGILGVINQVPQAEIIKWVIDNFDSRYEMGISIGFMGKEKLSDVISNEDTEGIIRQGFEDGWKVRNHLKACGYKIKASAK